MKNFNEAAHNHLIANGYAHRRIEANWEDIGGPESGPDIDGHPAADEYMSDVDYVFVDEYGRAFFEPRDKAFEAYCDEMGDHFFPEAKA